ncbi:MAG: hypothetical protein LQ342_000935 [Letrouitia transgressa]|nr:MAG: hypothetical protein LQ342_000935 [Letrouitia transgressa]
MTEVHITRELAASSQKGPSLSFNSPGGLSNHRHEGHVPERGLNQYSVNISSAPLSPTLEDLAPGPPPTPSATAAMQYRNNRAALEANTAAWGYTKVPSSMNRVYSLIHPELVSIPFTYASAIVLPLMGFWNSVIYITTSWAATKDICCSILGNICSRTWIAGPSPRLSSFWRPKGSEVSTNSNGREEGSLSDSTRGLKGRYFGPDTI